MSYASELYETDDLNELFEYDDESDDLSEAPAISNLLNRVRPLARPPVATGRNLFQPRPATTATGTAQYVTQAQLQAALARVGDQVKTNAQAIATVNTRLNAINEQQARQTAALKKEYADRRKDSSTLKRELRQTRDMSALLPLLSRPSTVTVTKTIDDGVPAGTKLVVDKGDTMSMMLPFLLMGGMGGMGGSTEGSGDNNMMMMLVMMMAMSGK